MRKTLLALCCLWSFSDSVAIDNSSLIQSSVMVVNLSHPNVLYSENSDLRLTPASTSKLFVAATALRQLGSDYHFTTQIYARGKLSSGILHGDLIFYGMGDPSLTNEQLWLLANQLKQLGLKSIEGNLVINKSYLGEVAVHSPDRIQAQHFSDSAYEGLLSSTGSNFGTVGISIFSAAGNAGQAHVVVTPFALDNVSLIGKVELSGNNENPLVLMRQSKNNMEYLTISGSVNEMSEPKIIYRSVGNPDMLTGNLFKGFLATMGITFHGKIIIENVPLTSGDHLLTSIDSARLIQLLQDMLYNSNNYMADMLTLDMWRAQQNKISNKTDLAIAAENLIDEYQKLAKKSSFYDEKLGLPLLESGSGLTPGTKISAHDLIILLDGMYQDRNNFSFLYGALPSFATTTHWLYKLNDSQLMWAKQLMVKTGSMGELPVLSMAGYFRLKNGDMAAFAIILNQEPKAEIKSVKQSELPDEMMRKVQNAVVSKM